MSKTRVSLTLCRVPMIAVAVLALMSFAGVATAATSTPTSSSAGPWAANVDLGFTNRSGDGDFDAHALFGASIEWFQDENVSWRGAMSMHSFDGPAFQQPLRAFNDEDIMAFNGNILYHWTGNTTAQPFVTGGVGIYNYQPDFSAHHSEAGVDVGGGIDLFAAPAFAIKLEALLHQTTANSHDTFVAGSAGIRFRW